MTPVSAEAAFRTQKTLLILQDLYLRGLLCGFRSPFRKRMVFSGTQASRAHHASVSRFPSRRRVIQAPLLHMANAQGARMLCRVLRTLYL